MYHLDHAPYSLYSDLLSSALEGGSNYWYVIKKKTPPTEIVFRSEPEAPLGRMYLQDYPINPGGSLLFSTVDDDEIDGKKEFLLDRAALERGIKLMEEEYPHHFHDALNETGDADTGDVLLQLCLFSRVVFG